MISAQRQRPWFLWVVAAALNGLFLLPAQIVPAHPTALLAGDHGWREMFTRAWISLDVLLLATLVSLGLRHGRLQGSLMVAVALGGLAWLYELYDVGILVMFRRQPVLYDDVRLLDDAFNLAVDLSGFLWLALGVGLLALLGTVALVMPWLLRELARTLAARPPDARSRSRSRYVLLGMWTLAALAAAERAPVLRDSMAQSSLARLAANISRSFAMRAQMLALLREPAGDAAAYFDGAALHHRPDVYLFMVESYGRVSATHPNLHERYRRSLEQMQGRLTASGWHAATHWSTAPVHGGASWLSAASVLGGVRIDNQHVYDIFTNRRPYAMPAFFGARGYRTVGVFPAVRERPGLPLREPYGFDIALFWRDLDYHGPSYGWGVVPDQYSLGVAHDRVLAGCQEPVFLYFVGVSSHAPWNPPPPLVGDWRTLNAAPPPQERRFWARLRHKARDRWRDHDTFQPASYQDAVDYDLRLLVEYLETQARRPAVALILGDHQPPFVAAGGDDASPVHIVTSDDELIDILGTLGFTEGLVPAVHAQHTLSHEALFSLLVHVLARAYGPPGVAPPPVLASGLPRSSILGHSRREPAQLPPQNARMDAGHSP